MTGAVKTIFRTGRAWGTARTRARTARRPAPTISTGAALATGAAGGAAVAFFLDRQNGPRRRRIARKRLMALLRRGKDEGVRRASNAAGMAKSAATKPTGADDGAEDVPGETSPTEETVVAR